MGFINKRAKLLLRKTLVFWYVSTQLYKQGETTQGEVGEMRLVSHVADYQDLQLNWSSEHS